MNCKQRNCDNVATHRVFWPGNEPLETCKIHAQTALTMANAMGFHLHVEELPYKPANEGESNHQETY